MVYLCPTSQGTSGGFAPGHQNVYLNIILDALLPWAHKVLSCPNLENRLFLILNINPDVFPLLMRGEVRDVEQDFTSSLDIPMRFQKIIFTVCYSLHWTEKLVRQLQAWLPVAALFPYSWAWGAHRPTRPCEKSIWESKWSFLIYISAVSFYFFPCTQCCYEIALPITGGHRPPKVTFCIQPEAQFHIENYIFWTRYI